MANPNIKISVTADTKDAEKGLKGIGKEADDIGGKLGGVGKVAAIGGVALAAFAAKGISDFENLGVSVGKLHDATGLSYEDASRLSEVWGDLGLSTDDLGTAIGKMEKKLGTNEEAFTKYGVAVVHAADGSVDANATFLASIDALNAIEDPTKRAAAGADIFGKSWANMAEVINMEPGKLRENLASVSDAKIFDEKKVQDARDLREAFDQVKDAGEDLFLTIGKALAPVIAKLAPTIAEVVEAVGPLVEGLGEALTPILESLGPIIDGLMPVIMALAKALGFVGESLAWAMGPHSEAMTAIKGFMETLGEMKVKAYESGVSAQDFQKMFNESFKGLDATSLEDQAKGLDILEGKLLSSSDRTASWSDSAQIMFERSGHVADGLDDVAESADDTATAISAFDQKVKDANEDYSLLIGKLDEADAWANAQQSIMDFGEKGADASAQDVRDLTRDLAGFIEKAASVPTEKKTRLYALLDQGAFDDVERQLAIMERNRIVSVSIVAKGGVGYSSFPQFASGGTVPGPRGKPTLAVVHGGEHVIPVGQSAASSGWSGGGITVIVQGSVTTERDLVRAIYDGIIDGQARGELPAVLVG